MTPGGAPLPPLPPDKEFFNIGEASRIAQVEPHTLRYWECQFPSLRPVRLPGGHRRYSRRDLELVLRIKDLIRHKRLTVAGARRALSARSNAGPPPAPSAAAAGAMKLLRELREDVRKMLAELTR